MVFVFGVDVPLVEMVFVLCLLLIILMILLLYVILNQRAINKNINKMMLEENKELENLKDVRKEEKDELNMLKIIREDLDKLMYKKGEEKKTIKLSEYERITQKKIAMLKDKISKMEEERRKTFCPKCSHLLIRDGKVKSDRYGTMKVVYRCETCNTNWITDENEKLVLLEEYK